MWLLKCYLSSFSLRYAPIEGLRSKCMEVARPCFRERNPGTRKLREGWGDGGPTSTCTETSYPPRDATTAPPSPNPSTRNQFLAKLGKGWNLPAADPRRGKQLACPRQPWGNGTPPGFGIAARCLGGSGGDVSADSGGGKSGEYPGPFGHWAKGETADGYGTTPRSSGFCNPWIKVWKEKSRWTKQYI